MVHVTKTIYFWGGRCCKGMSFGRSVLGFTFGVGTCLAGSYYYLIRNQMQLIESVNENIKKTEMFRENIMKTIKDIEVNKENIRMIQENFVSSNELKRINNEISNEIEKNRSLILQVKADLWDAEQELYKEK